MLEQLLKYQSEGDLCTEYYTPTELIGIYNNMLVKHNTHPNLITMRGIYKPGMRPEYYNYDLLRDEQTGDEITLFLSPEQKSKLKLGNLIFVMGIINRSIIKGGMIKLMIKATRIHIIEETAITENDMKLFELHKKKLNKGFKDIESVIKEKLYADIKPRISLLFAESSGVGPEFKEALSSAQGSIDFIESRTSFAQVGTFKAMLAQLDKEGFDSIAIIRGGGSGIDFFDKAEVLEGIINMNTPVISAVGHKTEKFFLKEVADKVIDTPTALGGFFRDMVEGVMQQKEKSKAILIEQVRKQFIDRIDTQEKQNKELTVQIQTITKSNKESTEKAASQIRSLTDQLKEVSDKSQKTINDLTKQIQETREQNKTATDTSLKKDEVNQKLIEDLTKQIQETKEVQKGHLEEVNKQSQSYLEQIRRNNTLLETKNKEIQDKIREIAELRNGKSQGVSIIILIIVAIVMFMLGGLLIR